MGREQKRKLLRVFYVALAILLLAGVLLILRPPCPILQGTGYYCGACGVTRMAEELLAGHVGRAFRENPYMFFVLPLGAAYLVGEGVLYVRGRRPLYKRRWMLPLLVVVIAVGMVFTVLRNLPGFEALRPV